MPMRVLLTQMTRVCRVLSLHKHEPSKRPKKADVLFGLSPYRPAGSSGQQCTQGFSHHLQVSTPRCRSHHTSQQMLMRAVPPIHPTRKKIT